MRFKQKALERAVYKTLGLFSNFFYITSVVTAIYTALVVAAITTADDTQTIGSLSGVLISTTLAALIQLFLASRLRSIRDDMVEYPDSEI